MTSLEHTELKGMTVRIFIITIVSAVTMSASVLGSYFGLKSDISEVKSQTDANSRVNEIRLKLLESQVAILQDELKSKK